MKSSIKRHDQLLKKHFVNFVIQIILITCLLPIVGLVLIEFVSVSDFQWLYDYSPSVYKNAVLIFNFMLDLRILIPLLLVIWIFVTLCLLYRLLKKIFSYIDVISKATNDLFNKEIDYIELPIELEEFQRQVNYLKRESEKNERLAMESEQKKNDLIVYLAHDLKTPLTSMIGYLSLLDEVGDIPKKQREKYIHIALGKSYKLEELINELFDIARFNSEVIVLENEEINLRIMLEQVIDDFYPVLKENNKDIELKMNTKIVLEGDSDKLARVFNNLIKNAIYYSIDNLITIEVLEEKNYVNIIISNKGKKIPPEKLKRVFEKFYRADSARTSSLGGSGLGLAIAREIVELHKGKIEATSDNDYTRFYVKLPIKNS